MVGAIRRKSAKSHPRQCAIRLQVILSYREAAKLKKRLTSMLLTVGILAGTVMAGQVVYIPFDDSTVPSVGADRLTPGVSESIAFVPGRRGKAVGLTAQTSPLCYGGVGSLLSATGTLEFWVRPLAWKGIDRDERFSLSLDLGDAAIRMFTDTRRSIMVTQVDIAGTSRQYISPIHYWGQYANQDQQVVITRNGSDIGIWIDGQRSILSDDFVTPPPHAVPVRADALCFGSQWDTVIDELRIYDQCFPDEQMVDRYVAACLKKKHYVPPTVAVPYVESVTMADGRVDDAQWSQCATVADFVEMENGLLFPRGTWVDLMYDDSAVYIRCRSRLVDGTLTGQKQVQDVWPGGDAVELFFMPAYTETWDFYQFVADPFGSHFDSRGRNDQQWNGTWTTMSSMDDAWWTITFVITDFASMGIEPPKDATAWRANICRNWRSGDVAWTQWALTNGVYHDYSGFGSLFFSAKDSPRVQVKTLVDTSAADDAVMAVMDIVNPAVAEAEVAVAYDFYPKGDYLPAASIRKRITVAGGSTLPLQVSCPLAGTTQGHGRYAHQQCVR